MYYNTYFQSNFKYIKSLGQHFLKDQNLADNIVRFIGNIKKDIVIEIGPGSGIMTSAILKISQPKLLIAIEKDRRLIPFLQKAFSSYINFNLIEGDALEVRELDIISDAKNRIEDGLARVHIIGNLPYNIATELIFKWLEIRSHISSMLLMVQREVADRICGKSGQCSLSFIISLLAEVEVIMNIKKEEFEPIPKVNSSMIYIKLRQDTNEYDIDKLSNFTRAIFSNKRKMIGNIMRTKFGEMGADTLKALSINPLIRAEEIRTKDLIMIYRNIISR